MRANTNMEPIPQDILNETIYRLDGPLRWVLNENRDLVCRAEVQEGSKVLDLGAGTGYLSLMLAEVVGASGLVYCLDRSSQLLELIQKKAKKKGLRNIQLVNTNAHSLDFPDNHFDAVLSSYLFHELADLAPQTVKECYRVLKPLRKFVIADFRRIEDKERLQEIEKWYAAQRDGAGEGEQHLRFSLQDLERMFVEAGFRSIEISTWLDFHMHGIAIK